MHATWLVCLTTMRTVMRTARALGLVVMALIAVGVAVAVRRSTSLDPDVVATQVIDGLGLTVVVPVTCLIVGVAVVGDFVEDRTLVYLWLRPIARVRLAAGMSGAALAICLPLTVITVTAMAIITSGSPEIVMASVAASALATLAYVCAFALLGALTTRALAWGIGYVLIYENFIARGGRGLGFFSVHSHAVSILAATPAGDRADIGLGYFALVVSSVALVAFAASAFIGLTHRLRRLEVA